MAPAVPVCAGEMQLGLEAHRRNFRQNPPLNWCSGEQGEKKDGKGGGIRGKTLSEASTGPRVCSSAKCIQLWPGLGSAPGPLRWMEN